MNTAFEPLSIVIFGGTGDLTKKKLIFALMDLYCQDLLPKQITIIGVAREEHSDESYRQFAEKLIDNKKHKHPQKKVKDFLGRLHYVQADISESASYQKLRERVDELDKKQGVCSSLLFYLAVSPSLYAQVFQSLSDSGLKKPCSDETWVRVAVEKPFGNDLETARDLDKLLGGLFEEEQIFRIDHYLGKETLENILAFRFSNVLFEPVWNNRYIESIEITLYESFGVGTRGSFYEGVGALRDVGQNHILQMLALTTMDDPGELSASAIRAKREQILSSLVPLDMEADAESIVKGQYASYLKEKNVEADSKNETFFRLTTSLAHSRWEGVPITIQTGKKMPDDRIEIRVKFKPVESCVCALPETGPVGNNEVVFRMQPNETIGISFWTKKRGFTMEVEERQLCFDYAEATEGRVRDAYEKILLDAIRGDQTLFTTSREVESTWEFINPIVEGWRDWEPVVYQDGTLPEPPAEKTDKK